MNDWHDRLERLNVQASALAGTTDEGKWQTLLADITAYHHELNANMQRLMVTFRSIARPDTREAACPVLAWANPDEWSPQSIAQIVLDATDVARDASHFLAFVRAFGAGSSDNTVSRIRGCLAVISRVNSLCEILLGLPLEDDEYTAELRDVLSLDEMTRSRLTSTYGGQK